MEAKLESSPGTSIYPPIINGESDKDDKEERERFSEAEIEEKADSGLNFTIESGEEMVSQASVASRNSFDGFALESTSIPSIADSGLGTRSTFSMKKMKRMASDSKIMLDKAFRRKLSEKKIQLLEQNFEQERERSEKVFENSQLQDELDTKIIETNDASRRNVELELDVKRLSVDLNSAMKRCEKLTAELSETSKQLKYSKEGIMAEDNDAFVMVIEKIESALSKIDESIVYSNYPGFDVFESLEDISSILDEAAGRSRYLLVREDFLAKILSESSELSLREHFKNNNLDPEIMSEKQKMRELLKALPELSLSVEVEQTISGKEDLCFQFQSAPLHTSTPLDSGSDATLYSSPPPKPPRTLRKLLSPGSSHSLGFTQSSLEYVVPAPKSKSLARRAAQSLRRKIVKLKP